MIIKSKKCIITKKGEATEQGINILKKMIEYNHFRSYEKSLFENDVEYLLLSMRVTN